ncbi:hypothetical protein J6590_017599 [Homalodisca vitripennis]|nr:hypothetical protein J6590_017599 [Homalodisca vitripennis]
MMILVLPHIIPFSLDEEVNNGESVQLNCHVSKGDIPLTIRWSFHGEALSSHMGISTTKIGDRTSLLTISSAMAAHSGNYTCTASNAAGNISHMATVHVNVLPHIIPFDLEEEVNSGESVQLNCHVSKGDRPIKISWNFHGEVLSSHMGISTTKLGDRSSVLTISSAMAAHSGNYTCTASNAAGVTTYTATVHVNVMPVITPISIEAQVFSGETIQLNCFVSRGDSPISISWFLNGERLSMMGPLLSTTQVGPRTSLLTISSATAWHSGNYTCTAQNRAGITNYTVSLLVHVRPEISPIAVQSQVFAGESVQLFCTVSRGDLPVSATWLFNGERLSMSGAGMTTTQVGPRTLLLAIHSATAWNSGNYTCLVENLAGLTEYTVPLMVHGMDMRRGMCMTILPSVVPFSFGNEPIQAGQFASVQCIVSSGDLPLTITWTFNGYPLRVSDLITVSKGGQRISTLAIESVSERLAGNYSCLARNDAGVDSHTSLLRVNVLPVIKPISVEGQTFAGEAVQLQCFVPRGDTPLSVWWVFNEDKQASMGASFSTTQLGPRTSLLTISAATAWHSGNYTCHANNRAGETTATVPLTVHGPVPYVLGASAPSVVPFSFGSDPIQAEQVTSVQCIVSAGDLPLTITWAFNGYPLQSSDLVSIAKSGHRISTLAIESVSARLAGNYTCIARNDAGIASHTSELKVNVPPKMMPFTFGDDPLEASQSATVQCSVTTGDLPLSIEWLFNGQTINEVDDVIVAKISKRASALSIESVTARHAGNYTCVGINIAGNASFTAQLLVNVPPKIIPFTFGEAPLEAGQSTSVQCMVSVGDPPLSIDWTVDGEVLESTPERMISKVTGKLSLLSIEAVSAHHAGNYTCSVANSAGHSNHMAQLLVIGPNFAVHLETKYFTNFLSVPPKMMTFTFGEDPFEAGQSTSVQCMVSSGDLPLNIEWTFNGKTVTPSQRDLSTVKIGQRGMVLNIDAVSARHAGNYTCIGRNSAGSASYTAQLLVNGL